MASSMSVNMSAQQAHDELLAAQPAGVNHSCQLCPSSGTVEKAEEAVVAGETERTYTLQEHQALLNDAVARESADLRSAKEDLESNFGTEKAALELKVTSLETEKAELLAKLDVAEAEKAEETKKAEDIAAAFEAHKSEIARSEEVQAKKADRITRIKAAKENLKDSYFTDERVTRWAEMADEAFDSLLADFTDAKSDEVVADGKAVVEQARETAAFSGGTAVAAPPTGGAFAQLMSQINKVPASIVGADQN